MKWRKAKPEIKPTPIILSIPRLDVSHVISYEKRPRPDQLVFVVRNDEGREWMLPPMILNGQHECTVELPLSFMTGRTEDAAKLARIIGRFYYS